MRLIVTIPERWEDASCPVGWALLNHDATLAREGEGLIGELPKAQQVTAVVAASRVLLTATKLPSPLDLPFRTSEEKQTQGRKGAKAQILNFFASLRLRAFAFELR